GHLAQNGAAYDIAARSLLERGRVEVGDSVEAVLPLGERPRGLGHGGPGALVRGPQLERCRGRPGLMLADRHLEGRLVRQLAEPAYVRDDEWLAERERPDRGTRGLAHGR